MGEERRASRNKGGIIDPLNPRCHPYRLVEQGSRACGAAYAPTSAALVLHEEQPFAQGAGEHRDNAWLRFQERKREGQSRASSFPPASGQDAGDEPV